VARRVFSGVFAKDQSGNLRRRVALSLSPVDLVELTAYSLELMLPAARAKGVTLTAKLPAEPITITADAQRLEQVIWHLLSSALVVTPKGGHVRVVTEFDGSDARIEVTDGGDAIEADAMPYVFEPPRAGETTRHPSGRGLGLAIVKEIVMAHGGTVHAEKGSGRGATLAVRLPARAALLDFGSEATPESGTVEHFRGFERRRVGKAG
jgi:signal transduction histidine kinase